MHYVFRHRRCRTRVYTHSYTTRRSQDSFVNDGPLSYETCSSQEEETSPISEVSPCGKGGGEGGGGGKKRRRGRPKIDDDGDEKVEAQEMGLPRQCSSVKLGATLLCWVVVWGDLLNWVGFWASNGMVFFFVFIDSLLHCLCAYILCMFDCSFASLFCFFVL